MKKHFIVPLMSLLVLSACTNPENNNASESVTFQEISQKLTLAINRFLETILKE